ncbi:PREDICTED: plant cysteine oxidase 2-like [Tarenaya hassleriana]|uniref:plant cysteine oxidase 2-like n=1 Tax=Tarenaya hassleriana TaxID=28532 RepID=UPI00053C7BC5|nr:PREDICTED: plant cysteine oxidase 2-like [Tarenaya hassleriana]
MITVDAGGMVEQRRRSTSAAVMAVGKKVGYASKVVMKRKQRWRKRRRTAAESFPVKSTALQRLFVSCKDVFSGSNDVPSPSDVQMLTAILDDIKPEDVGLSKELQFFKASKVPKGTPRVTYTTIYQCNQFSLCIFFLPAKAVIPLHNHPGMTVFSKLLLGTMHIKSYDWVDPANSHSSVPNVNPQARMAEMVTNNVFTAPCDTNVLYPTSGGNIHEFRAITPCAVLDVIGPPYSAKDNRDCSYYKELPHDAVTDEEEKESYGWLQEIEVPEDSQMDGIEYLGPQVIDSSTHPYY